MAGNSLSFITDGLWTSAFVMRKKGCYHKNRPFRLLVAAALRFVQFYLNDIELLGVTSDLSDAPAIDSDYLWLFCILSNIVHTHQGFIFGPEYSHKSGEAVPFRIASPPLFNSSIL